MAEIKRRVRPVPLQIEVYLDNPHRGCCTFQHFNGDPLFAGTTWSEEGPVEFPPPVQPPVIDGYLPTTVSYCRWFWRLMEPQKGRFDFSMIDRSLETCAARGQTLALRVMAFGAGGQPQLPDWYVAKCPTHVEDYGGPVIYPDHDGPEYLERWGGFVREVGRRYDGHPLLETMDVAYLGPWGEEAGVCTRSTMDAFNALWREAFPRTPRLAEIGDGQLAAGRASGAGWRMNSFGDLSDGGSPAVTRDVSWNHMYEALPKQVPEAGAQDAWREVPIFFETGWVPMYWHQRGWDIDFILEQGLKYHPTYFMPKYTRLPEAWRGKLAALCNRIGYRYILRHALYDRQAPRTGSLRFECWIENVGVAPIYRPYTFALRLRQGDADVVIPMPDIDIRTWQPGDVWLNREVKVPAGLRPGWAELAAGLLDAKGEARVRFAVREQFSDGWVDLGGVEVV